MKIESKLLWPMLGMALLVALVGAIAVNRQEVAAKTTAIAEAENVAHALGVALILDSNHLNDSARAVVRRLHQTERRDIVLVNTERRVLADAVPASVGEIFDTDPHGEVAATIRDGKVRTFIEINEHSLTGMKQIVTPVRSESGEILGAVILEYTPMYDALMQSTRITINQLIMVVLVSMTIALGLAFYLGRSIATPLKQLKNAAMKFAGGQADLQMPPPRMDEIGELQTAFHDMMGKRQEAESSLRQLSNELEARVLARTTELARANEALVMEMEVRSKTETALVRLAAIVESSDDAIIGKDLYGVITDWNRGAEKIFGYLAGEAKGQPILMLFPPDRLSDEPEILARIARGESMDNFETVRIRKDKQPIHVSITISPIKDHFGNIVGASTIANDITARKQAEEERGASEARYRTLFDYAPDGIIITDSEGRCRDANRSLCRMLGHTREELIGLAVKEIVIQSEVEHIEPALAVINGKSDYSREWQFRRKNGSSFAAEVIGTMMPDGNLLGMIRDVTERKKLEQRFLRAQRMESIGTLAGGIAHDLNNVLAPIIMAVAMLKDRARDEEDIGMLTTLLTSAQRGADLVKQVLSFARGVEGQRILVSPAHILRDLINVMKTTFPKSIDVSFNLPASLWTVTGDPSQMHQVFLNLCVNARDAMPGGGKLRISAENVMLDEIYAAMNSECRPGAFLLVTVEDNGTGIPPEVRERIFEPFFTTKGIGKGTGLGLSTTMAIVKGHGGFINVYSEVGKGTRFKVYLPANSAEMAMAKPEPEKNQLPRGNGELILVVDDEEAIRKIARHMLECFGYRTLLATNGAEAMAVYQQHHAEIAAVLTDMSMPMMDGPTMVAAMKLMNPEVCLIGSSGLTSNSAFADATGADIDDFIAKPYTGELLLKTLQRVLREKKNSPCLLGMS